MRRVTGGSSPSRHRPAFRPGLLASDDPVARVPGAVPGPVARQNVRGSSAAHAAAAAGATRTGWIAGQPVSSRLRATSAATWRMRPRPQRVVRPARRAGSTRRTSLCSVAVARSRMRTGVRGMASGSDRWAFSSYRGDAPKNESGPVPGTRAIASARLRPASRMGKPVPIARQGSAPGVARPSLARFAGGNAACRR